jgi:hypothetical protein
MGIAKLVITQRNSNQLVVFIRKFFLGMPVA